MKIYTKTGDLGTTSLFGGQRVDKHHVRIESYGTIDELNAWIGMLRDQMQDHLLRDILIDIQDKLFILGAVLATPKEKQILKNGKPRLDIQRVQDEDIRFLEEQIDAMELELPPMTHFVLPGGHPVVSYCHLARTVCRRAERRVSHLNELEAVDNEILRYLNRLSDYLFVLGRRLSHDLGATEVPWIPKKPE